MPAASASSPAVCTTRAWPDSRVQNVLLVAAVTGAVAAAPRWYAHRFNRAVVYRVATAVASELPRPARLRVAAALAGIGWRRFTDVGGVVRRNLARLLHGENVR